MLWHRWEKISQSHLKIWQKYVMHWNVLQMMYVVLRRVEMND